MFRGIDLLGRNNGRTAGKAEGKERGSRASILDNDKGITALAVTNSW